MTEKLLILSAILLILGPIAPSSTQAQGFGASFDSIASNSSAVVGTTASDIATNIHLNGTIVSQTARSALINNRIAREGDRIANAEVLSISEGTVRILANSKEYTLRVGSSIVVEHNPDSIDALTSFDTDLVQVQKGQTLSEIAQGHLVGGVTMNQMMIAMFRANPEAFGDNINVLRAGSVLRIPNQSELHEQSAETATVAVARHMDAWRADRRPTIQLAAAIDAETYGPVASGETLSEIALKVSRDGVTMNQMMIALAEANPGAFNGNINVLQRGAVLKVPDGPELNRRTPAAATAEVSRQMQAWRPDNWQQPQLATKLDSTAAFSPG